MTSADSSIHTPPRVTIGLPVFNGERYIRQTLDAVLGQTYSSFELLIGDNASTDATGEICAASAARDPRVRILRADRNQGAAWNYNRLVQEARGTYFKWMPHDDLIAPEFLAQCVEYLEAHPSVILCYPTTVPIDHRGDRLARDPEDALKVSGTQPAERLRQYIDSSFTNRQCNAVLGVIRTAVLRRTGLIGAYAGSDKILLCDLALAGPFHQLPAPLFFRRYHESGSLAQHPNAEERDSWFDTRKSAPRHFVQWKWFAAHAGSIRRSHLTLGEKTAAFAQLRRYLFLYRYALKDELKDVLSSRGGSGRRGGTT